MKVIKNREKLQPLVPELKNIRKPKEKKYMKKLRLECNRVSVYFLFCTAVIIVCLSILDLKTFMLNDKAENSNTTNGDPMPTSKANSNDTDKDKSDGGSITIKEIHQYAFSLIIIWISSIGVSHIFERLKFPGLLGVLLLGLLFRNTPFISKNLHISHVIGSSLRKFAFSIILLRAGLGLDSKALMKLKKACVLLAFLPCTFEAFTVGISAWLILKLHFMFGLLLGFVLGAVSPAVIVQGMLELKSKKLGVDKGIPTLINAAASIDDAYAITWFSLVFSFVTSESDASPFWTITCSVLEVFSGIALGTFLGLILWIFPDRKIANLKLRRITLLLSFALAALFGTDYLGSQTIGPIAVLVLGFVSAIRWHKLSRKETLKEEKLLKSVWDYVALPFLFCLIGYQFDFEQLDKSSIFQSIVVLNFGLIVRCIVAAIAVTGTKLNFKEKIFVAISWLPKATVQAALAPVLLDLTRKHPTKYGKYQSEAAIVLSVAIISILITAPTGAILVRLLGPKMLNSAKHPVKQDPIELEEQTALKS